MSQTQITNEIAKASAKRFLRTVDLTRKYGRAAIEAMNAVKEAHPDRLRIYGREAGGIGPAA